MHFRLQFALFVLLASRVPWSVPALAAEPRLELRTGDHVCLVGNTLADRMQHDGWLETVLQTRLPHEKLVIRNLGFAADEVDKRPRSQNFGDSDKHLAHCQADVVFAFFGYNESFAGPGGVPSFREKLAKFVDHTLGRSTTASPPRSWCCSRRSPTRTCTTRGCLTARRTTSGSKPTPRRSPTWRGRRTCRSSTCSTPRANSTRRPRRR